MTNGMRESNFQVSKKRTKCKSVYEYNRLLKGRRFEIGKEKLL